MYVDHTLALESGAVPLHPCTIADINAVSEDWSVDLPEGTCVIPLTKGFVAVVDIVDAPFLLKHTWYASVKKNGAVYAARSSKVADGLSKCTMIYMHREVAGVLPISSVLIDHDNGNTLDNTRRNLVTCVTKYNAINDHVVRGKVGYRGVSEVVRSHTTRYEVRMRIACDTDESGYIGTFDTPKEAARAYDTAVAEKLVSMRVAPRVIERLLNFPEEHAYLREMHAADEANNAVEEEIPF